MMFNDWHYQIYIIFTKLEGSEDVSLLNFLTFPSLIILVWGVSHFIYKIVNKRINIIGKVIILVLTISSQIISYNGILTFQYILILTITVLSIFVIKNYSRIGDRYVKSGLKNFIIISVLHLPVFILYILKINDMFITIYHNLYYLTLSIGTIFFGLKYFIRDPFLVDNKPTESYKKTYNITEREAEIVENLLLGNSTKNIADKLFISPKTVTNHISNIYVKTGVKNRIQLLNMLNNNSLS